MRVRAGVEEGDGESKDVCEDVAWGAASKGVQLAQGRSWQRGAAC